MKSIVWISSVGILAFLISFGCTNKKVENNIKSLEKRVAALERKQGIEPANQTIASQAKGEAVLSNNAPGQYAAIQFDQMEYNFGSVNEGDIVEHVFRFTNEGDIPLVISKATATCGCTVPEWPKEPIAKGGTGQITVKFNSKGRKNLQTKYVNILANTSPEQTRLKITGTVVPNS